MDFGFTEDRKTPNGTKLFIVMSIKFLNEDVLLYFIIMFYTYVLIAIGHLHFRRTEYCLFWV